MAPPIRVLVVDDSALMRQMISRFLQEGGCDVVGTARDGVEALEKALALRPDVITLDVEMPVKNGLAFLDDLMSTLPTPVVMVSSLTQRDAPMAVEALARGAVDVVAKPGGSISLNLAEIRDELIRKVRVAARARLPQRAAHCAASGCATGAATGWGPARLPVRFGRRVRTQRDRIVVIGSSTGGPAALAAVLPRLPVDFPAPIIIVQHMLQGFLAPFAQRLDRIAALPVTEARAGERPRPGSVWVAPGGVHLVFDRRGVAYFSSDPPQHGVRPAIDPTLESAALAWGAGTVAVILTGMGKDGARGARAVRQAGGTVIAQDEESSVIFGMPRVVIEMGFADAVCSLDALPQVLWDVVASPRERRSGVGCRL